MTEREADLVVADDAEMEGKHDIAEQLRTRHLGEEQAAVWRKVEEYRIKLGLIPWVEHAAAARKQMEDLAAKGYHHERSRRSGRSTSDMLAAIAHCEISGRRLLVIVGSGMIRQHCEQLARDLLGQLGISDIAIKVASDRSPHLLLGMRPHVVYRDHADFEFPMRTTSRGQRPPP